MMSEKIRPHHLERKAILYVRQSSAHQVLHNRESSTPRILVLPMLADNDGYTFFNALGDLVTTGPTLTNVNDFRAIFVQSEL
jgi:glycerate-2-kinase